MLVEKYPSTTCFNRYIVECKLKVELPLGCIEFRFNRYIVECK